MRMNRRGQVTAEMAVLFTFVIAAFVFMGVYLQRATQGGVKSNADGLGSQFSTKSPWNSNTVTNNNSTDTQTTSNTVSSHYDHTLTGP